MFGTVIVDAYKKSETTEIATAIDDLCCPTDNYGWASAGIYCFWDYNTHKVGGSFAGQKRVLKNNINIVKSFSNPQAYKNNPIVSRSTLRELSQHPEYESYESYLHAVRMYMLMQGMDYMDALSFANKMDTFGWYQHMVDSNYIKKELIV